MTPVVVRPVVSVIRYGYRLGSGSATMVRSACQRVNRSVATA